MLINCILFIAIFGSKLALGQQARKPVTKLLSEDWNLFKEKINIPTVDLSKDRKWYKIKISLTLSKNFKSLGKHLFFY